MDYRALGRSDLQVSAICLGTMTFGEQNTEADAHAQLDYAVERGVNVIDIAEMYPVPARAATSGLSERFVGSWLRTGRRDRVIIATKVAGPSRGWHWIRGGPLALDRTNIRSALEASLRRLGTDYVDLYQIHWPARKVPTFGQYQFVPSSEEGVTPILEQLEALAELVREGKVRHVGLSNEHPWGVMEFLRLSVAHGLPRVVSIQNAYNLLNRTIEFSLAEVLHREGVGLMAYSPLAFGHLSGKYVGPGSAQGRVTLYPAFGQRYAKPNVAPAVREYVRLARDSGLSPAQLALGYVYRHWCVTTTIVGATTIEQLRENMDVWCAPPLSQDVLARIDDIHLRYTNPAL
jgi:aryl-alcohol dehydrogenase-like predicted oxidoreductase